jgi:hypothetical protein
MIRNCANCGLIHEWSGCPRCLDAETPNETIVFADLPQYAIMSDSLNTGHCVACGGVTTWEYHYKSVCEGCQAAFVGVRNN